MAETGSDFRTEPGIDLRPAGQYQGQAFDYEQENRSVEEKIEKAMSSFDFTDTGYCYDTHPPEESYIFIIVPIVSLSMSAP